MGNYSPTAAAITIPRDAHREVKAYAALHGLSISELTLRALRAFMAPAPTAGPDEEPQPMSEKDREQLERYNSWRAKNNLPPVERIERVV